MKLNSFFTALLVMIFAWCRGANTQGISNKWLLGYASGFIGYGGINLNFDSIPIVPTIQNRKMNFNDLNASICDSHGNLLFYTNGGWISNKNNDTLQNGNNLAPGLYANQWKEDGFRIVQGGLIIPFPDDSNKFYLFHETVYFDSLNNIIPCKNLFYSTINMSLDNGLGGVVVKNAIALTDSLIYGELTACKHGNGRDWWVFTHQQNTDLFIKFLITPQGITGPFYQNIGSIQTQASPGQTCFSPNGKKFGRYTPTDDIDIYDFDRCSGLLSNNIHIGISDTAYAGGLAFSPNSRYLYASSYQYVYQFDVDNSNIASSKDTVAVFDGYSSPSPPFLTRFYLMQIAPNNKIYISTTNSTKHLHVINFPDSAGNSCNLVQHGVFLNAFNAFTIPNHPNYFLRADSGSICDTLMLSIPLNNFHEKLISISPNPAQNYFIVSYKSQYKSPYPFLLYNCLGEVVLVLKLDVSNSSLFVPTEDLINGIYFWKFQNQSGKIIIEK